MKQESIDAIVARKVFIAGQRKLLDDEERKLDIALEVIREYSGEPNDHPEEAIKGKPRPEGVPTTWEMVEAVLKPVDMQGGLTGAQIVAEIESKYWPGLVGAQILPVVYGYLKGKNPRLTKTESGKFHLRNG